MRDQLSLRVALSRTSEDGLRMIFDGQSNVLPFLSKVGQGYLKTDGMSKPVFFETPLIDVNLQELF